MAGISDMQAIAEVTVEELRRAFGYHLSAVVRVGPDDYVEAVAVRGESFDALHLRGWSQARDKGLIGRCLRERTPVLANDVRTDPGYQHTMWNASRPGRLRSEKNALSAQSRGAAVVGEMRVPQAKQELNTLRVTRLRVVRSDYVLQRITAGDEQRAACKEGAHARFPRQTGSRSVATGCPSGRKSRFPALYAGSRAASSAGVTVSIRAVSIH